MNGPDPGDRSGVADAREVAFADGLVPALSEADALAAALEAPVDPATLEPALGGAVAEPEQAEASNPRARSPDSGWRTDIGNPFRSSGEGKLSRPTHGTRPQDTRALPSRIHPSAAGASAPSGRRWTRRRPGLHGR